MAPPADGRNMSKTTPATRRPSPDRTCSAERARVSTSGRRFQHAVYVGPGQKALPQGRRGSMRRDVVHNLPRLLAQWLGLGLAARQGNLGQAAQDRPQNTAGAQTLGLGTRRVQRDLGLIEL